MPSEFRMVHRVEFADTDMAGIMHFSNFFRMMERTEHAFLRSLGLSVHMEHEGRVLGWPRVRAECEYRHPLRFEDEVEVLLRVREKKERSLAYEFRFLRAQEGGPLECARGQITAVCVSLDPSTGRMRSTPIPELLASQVDVAPADDPPRGRQGPVAPAPVEKDADSSCRPNSPSSRE